MAKLKRKTTKNNAEGEDRVENSQQKQRRGGRQSRKQWQQRTRQTNQKGENKFRRECRQ
jgi:hypothetical protein